MIMHDNKYSAELAEQAKRSYENIFKLYFLIKHPHVPNKSFSCISVYPADINCSCALG